MSNIPFMDRTRHVQGFAHGRWDDYSDVPDGGLAETDAFNDALQVHKTATPDGLAIDFRCNDLLPHGYTVEWPELVALANGLSPSDPRLRIDPQWAISYENNRQFPNYIGGGSCRCKSPVAVEITREEAYRALMQYKDLVARDARAGQVYGLLKQLGVIR